MQIKLQHVIKILRRFAKGITAPSQSISMQLSWVSTNQFAHPLALLKHSVLDLRVDVWVSHDNFLVDVIELLGEREALVLPASWKGSNEQL